MFLSPKTCMSMALVAMFSGLLAGLLALARHRVFFARILLALTGLYMAGLAAAQTPVSGVIGADARWTAARSPYVLSGEVIVDKSARLSVDAGVTVYMMPGASLVVNSGTLDAIGTPDKPIRVLSDKTRQGLSGAPGDWGQWRFRPGASQTRLEHVMIEHGSGLGIAGSSAVLNFVEIRNHQGPAVSIDLEASLSGVGNRATGNGVNGVVVPAGTISGQPDWSLRGLPFVVSGGEVSVGVPPTVSLLQPDAIERGETLAVRVEGSRLAGLAEVRFEGAGLTGQPQPGGTDASAGFEVSAAPDAAPGVVPVWLLTDAGEVRAGEIRVSSATARVLSVEPAVLYVGQGTAELVIRGRNFSADAQARFNGAAVPTRFESASELRAFVTPPAAIGTARIGVRTADPENRERTVDTNELALGVTQAKITINPAGIAVNRGGQRDVKVELPFVAPAIGIPVDLAVSNPALASAPTSVKVPGGARSVTFELQGLATGQTQLRATHAAFVAASAEISVVPPALQFIPANPIRPAGEQVLLTLRSDAPADSEGLAVALSSSNPAVASLEETAFIEPGALSVDVMVNALANGVAVLTAKAAGFSDASTVLTIKPLAAMQFPASVLLAPGGSNTVALTLAEPAPSGGLVVNLSAGPGVSVPASVTVPAGQRAAQFEVSAATPQAPRESFISLNAEGHHPAQIDVTVANVKPLASRSAGQIEPPEVVSVPMGMKALLKLYIEEPAPAGGLPVTLSVSDSGLVRLAKAEIVIPQGLTVAETEIELTGLARGEVVLSMRAPGINPGSLKVRVTGRPTVKFGTLRVVVGAGLTLADFTTRLYFQSDGEDYTPDAPINFTLTSSDPAKLAVPASFEYRARDFHTDVPLTGLAILEDPDAVVQVRASAPGLEPMETPLDVSVEQPTLSFFGIEGLRQINSRRDEFEVIIGVPGELGRQVLAADRIIRVSIADATPGGMVPGIFASGTSDVPITSLVIPAGGYTAQAWVGSPVSAGHYKVRAEAEGLEAVEFTTTVPGAPTLRFSTPSGNLGKGLKSSLSVARQAEGLGSGNWNESARLTFTVSAPDKVRIVKKVDFAARASYVDFELEGLELTSGTPVFVDVSAPGYTTTNRLTTQVVSPVVSFSNLDVSRVADLSPDVFQVVVGVPGEQFPSYSVSADMPVRLAVVNASPEGVVTGITNADGTRLTETVISSFGVSTPELVVPPAKMAGSYAIEAETSLGITRSPVVTVAESNIGKARAKFSTGSLTVGAHLVSVISDLIKLEMDGSPWFDHGNLRVTLVSSAPDILSVPSEVILRAGEAAVGVGLTAHGDSNGQPVSITATVEGVGQISPALQVKVVNPELRLMYLDGQRGVGSARDGFDVVLTVPGEDAHRGVKYLLGGMPVKLSLVQASPSDVVSGFFSAATGGLLATEVIIPPDRILTSVSAYVGTPLKEGSYVVRATMFDGRFFDSERQTVGPVSLHMTQSVTVGQGMRSWPQEGRVELKLADGRSVSIAQPLAVSLSCVDAAVCSTPASVVIPAARSFTDFEVDGLAVGTTTIAAAASGYQPASAARVTVVEPRLVPHVSSAQASNVEQLVVGREYLACVGIETPGSGYSGFQTMISTLALEWASSAPAVAAVMQSATLAPGDRRKCVPLTPLSPGSFSLTLKKAGVTVGTTAAATVVAAP